jgi:hypothetical protein
VGKTRPALQVAADVAGALADRVRSVGLAPVSGPGMAQGPSPGQPLAVPPPASEDALAAVLRAAVVVRARLR